MTQIDLSGYTDRILVDMTTRQIKDNDNRVCIQYDHKAIRKVFEIDRYLDGVDLSEKLASIHWACGDNGGVYPVTEWDTETAEGKIIIKWELAQRFTKRSVLVYAIHFYTQENDAFTYHVSTKPARVKIGISINTAEHSDRTGDPAAVEQLAGRLEEVKKSIVQSDYDQNDPDAGDYIKNRPFYEEVVFQCEITPDMDVSGMETIGGDGVSYIHISDTVIPEGTYSLWTTITTTDGQEQKGLEVFNEQIKYDEEEGYTEWNGSIIFANRDTELSGISLKKGIYVFSPSLIEANGFAKVNLKLEILKTIDDQFLVNTMSRRNPNGTGAFSMNTSKATGNCSFAENDRNIASGNHSHAEGVFSKASGAYSHAEGRSTTASGDTAHAEGLQTKASGDYSHVMGKYNVEDTENKYAFIIGGGTAENKRKNIFMVDWDGAATFNGQVSLSRNLGITQPYQLTTKSYVDGEINTKCLNFYIYGNGGVRYVTNDDHITFDEVLAYPKRYPIATFDGIRSTGEYAIDGILTQRFVSDEVISYGNVEIIGEDGVGKVVFNFVEFRSDGTKTTYGTETIGYLNAQADWEEQNEDAPGYIKNKPILEGGSSSNIVGIGDELRLFGVLANTMTVSEAHDLLKRNKLRLLLDNNYVDFNVNNNTLKLGYIEYSNANNKFQISTSTISCNFKPDNTNTSTSTST